MRHEHAMAALALAIKHTAPPDHGATTQSQYHHPITAQPPEHGSILPWACVLAWLFPRQPGHWGGGRSPLATTEQAPPSATPQHASSRNRTSVSAPCPPQPFLRAPLPAHPASWPATPILVLKVAPPNPACHSEWLTSHCHVHAQMILTPPFRFCSAASIQAVHLPFLFGSVVSLSMQQQSAP